VTLIRHVRDGARLLDLPDGEVSRLVQMAQGRDPDRLHRQFDLLAEAVDAITRSEQPMLLLEMAVVKMAAVRDFAPVQSLIDRLEALERKLRKGGFVAAPRESAPAPRRDKFVPPPLPKRDRTPPPTVTQPPKPAPAPPPTPKPIAPTPTPTAAVEAAPAVVTAAPSPAEATADDNFAGPPPIWDDGQGDSTPAGAAPSPAPRPEPQTPVERVPEAQAAGGPILNKLINYKRSPPDRPLTERPSATRPARQAPAAPPATAEPAVPAPVPTPDARPPVPAPVTTSDPPVSAAPESAPDRPPTPPTPIRPRAARAAEPGPTPEFDESRPDPAGSALCDASRWRRFVHSLADRPTLGPAVAAFARAGFLGADGTTIAIGFATEIGLRQMESLASTPGLMESVRAEFGDDVRLAWSVDVEDRRGRSLSDELLVRRRDKEQQVDSASRADQAVERVLARFPGSEIATVTFPDDLEIDDVR
jgi:hypothetical protein